MSIQLSFPVDKYLKYAISVLSVVAFLVVEVFRLYSLNKGLISSDEGWYCVLLRDCPHGLSTRFYFLFGGCFGNNVYLLRLVCNLLSVLGNVIFAGGLTIFLREIEKTSFILVFFTLYFGQLYFFDCPSFNYITINYIIITSALGLFLSYLATRRVLFVFLCGLLLSFLFPVMATNIIGIPFFILYLILFEDKPFAAISYLIFGCFSGFFGYLFLFDSPTQFFSDYFSVAQNTINNGTNAYGFKFLIGWLKIAILYISKYAIFAFIVIVCRNALSKFLPKSGLSFFLFLILCLVGFFIAFNWVYPISYTNAYWHYDMWLWIVFIVLFGNLQAVKGLSKEFCLSMLFLIEALCMSFGTNVGYQCRVWVYMSLYMPIIFLFFIKKLDTKYFILIILVILINLCTFVNSWFSPTWHGDIPSEQKYFVSSVGINQNIKVDKDYLEEIAFVNNLCSKGDPCLVSDNYWAHVLFSDLKPIDYSFRLKDVDNCMKQILENLNKGSIMLLLDNRNPDTEDLLNKLKTLDSVDVKVRIFHSLCVAKIVLLH